ncbi:uncharacterized protein LOC111463895 isoform X1 [Cucurbita moschata]|uniref:Uncharacterized protein LOC111463895 isoform X1 n=1 Tax=Cucurbita moschata TaxID=3662 RepID=A0A6J1HKQ3_CUCMO|nr:uncharacterized protein LOC111463895 isoform X1 [Cucurbita moschata]
MIVQACQADLAIGLYAWAHYLLPIVSCNPQARVKATERFEAIYPTLKEVALAGSPGSKAMKQVSQKIFSFAAKAAGESVSELSGEATNVFIWCLTQNVDCYKQWDKIYEDNLEASVSVLKKLSDDAELGTSFEYGKPKIPW